MRTIWLAVWMVGLGLLASAGQGECTLEVQPGASIQEALAAAPPGAVICLPQGSWEENLVVTKSVTIRGQGAERTRISGSGGTDPFCISQPVIWIKGEGAPITVIIEDLAIQGPPGSGSWWGLPHGLVAQGTARVEVRGVTVSGVPGFGIWLTGSAQATIQDTVVRENQYGIWLSDEALATLVRVRVSHNGGYNVALRGASRATITDSISEGAGLYGVFVDERAQLTLTGCRLIGGAGGLLLAGEAAGTVEDCLIQNAEGSSVFLMGWARLAIRRSTISGSEIGIGLMHYSSLEAVGCLIRENSLGIGLRHWSRAVITDNSILDNASYGVALIECFPEHPGMPLYAGEAFQGRVAGGGNTIRGNLLAQVCPAGLEFLATSEGGTLDLGG